MRFVRVGGPDRRGNEACIPLAFLIVGFAILFGLLCVMRIWNFRRTLMRIERSPGALFSRV